MKFDKVATGVLTLIVGLVVAGVFTLPTLWAMQGTQSVVVRLFVFILIFLAVIWSINLHVRPRDGEYR